MAFVVLGFILSRLSLLKQKGHDLLAYLSATLLLAVMVFNTFQTYYAPGKLPEILQFFVLFLAGSAGSLVLCYGGGKALGLSGAQMGCWLGSSIYLNAGFIGLPVVIALEIGGTSILFNGMVLIFTNILLSSTSDILIQRLAGSGRDLRLSPVKILLSPSLIGLLLALAVQMSGLSLSGGLQFALTGLGNTAAPAAMLLIGYKLSVISIREIFLDRRMYLFCLLKLILIPLVVCKLAGLAVRDPVTLVPFTVLMCCPAMSVLPIFVGRSGGDGVWSTKYVFLSIILSTITLPLMLLLLLS